MTGPLPLGSARVTVHADTDPFEREIERGVRKGADAADDDMRAAGKDMGDALADGMDDELTKKAPGIFGRFQTFWSKRKVKVSTDVDIDEGAIPDEIERAFARAFRTGGPLDQLEQNLGKAVSSGIGSGFNVSGRGPLLLLLLPFIGAIGVAIAGAVQIVNGLIALLYLIPSLIGAIALQAGVLFLAFRGVGEAISKAFAAKTPKEFEEALKGLTPQLQTFIRSLLPLRELFNDLSDLAQRNFFGAFGSILADFAKFMRYNLVLAVDKLSTSFGLLFSQLVAFFENPRFQEFFAGLIDSTVKWVDSLAPALLTLLEGFTELGIAVKPFFDWFGSKVADGIAAFGRWLQNLAADPEFTKWLEDMKETLKLTAIVLGAVVTTTKEFFKAIDEAGGNQLLEQIVFLLGEIEYFLSTDFGKDSLKGFLGTLLALSYIAVILIGGFLSFFGIIFRFVEWLDGTAGPRIKKFFTEDIPNWFRDLIDFLTPSADEIRGAITNAFEQARQAVNEKLEGVRQLIAGLPARIGGAINSLKDTLFQAGKDIIQRMMDGIREKLGPLGFLMDIAAGIVAARVPHSPAELGPLSGSGDPLIAGQKIIQRLAAGIQMETPALAAATNNATNNVTFGPGSIRVGFEGVVPTPQQAQTTGAAAGRGIMSQLMERNVRLAVRTL